VRVEILNRVEGGAEFLSRARRVVTFEGVDDAVQLAEDECLRFGQTLPIHVLGGGLLVVIDRGVGVGYLLLRLLHRLRQLGHAEKFLVEFLDGVVGDCLVRPA
jgi:hypothetical protein